MWRFSDVSGTPSPSSGCAEDGDGVSIRNVGKPSHPDATVCPRNYHWCSSDVGRSPTCWLFASIWWTYFVHVKTIHTVIKNGQFLFQYLLLLLFDFVPFHRHSWGDNTHANWSKDCRRQSQCKPLRLVELSRCYDCPTENCLYFAWLQLTLSGGSCLIAPKLVTALLRVTVSVWNVLQSATLAAIITPPQRRLTDWKVSAVIISCVLAHYEEVRSKLRSCRN